MDTCQTSIEDRYIIPNILLIEITAIGPQRIDLSGEGHADKQ